MDGSAVSHQLRILRHLGLARSAREGVGDPAREGAGAA
jgi:hypothetical protein